MAAFIPGLVLLKWVDKRPIRLLGIGCYNGFTKALAIGMLLGVFMGTGLALGLWLTGIASFSYNGFSLELLFYLFSCLVIFAISASFEELLFRGYIFQALIEGSNFWITLGVFSLLFGASHIDNPEITVLGVAFTIVAGVFLGVLYFKTRTLWMCIGVHFMWNWMMAICGIGISASPFIRRSVFNYTPIGAGADAMSEIIQCILMIGLTIFIWRSKRIMPAQENRELWSHYPSKHGITPANSE